VRLERTRGFTCDLDKGCVRPTRVQPADRHHWHCHGGRRIPHRLAFDHRGHSELSSRARLAAPGLNRTFAGRSERSGLDCSGSPFAEPASLRPLGSASSSCGYRSVWSDFGSYIASFAAGSLLAIDGRCTCELDGQESWRWSSAGGTHEVRYELRKRK